MQSGTRCTDPQVTWLQLAKFVVDRGWTYAPAAQDFHIRPRTAKKWSELPHRRFCALGYNCVIARPIHDDESGLEPARSSRGQ